MFRGYGNTGKICEVVEEVKLKALCSTSEKKNQMNIPLNLVSLGG